MNCKGTKDLSVRPDILKLLLEKYRKPMKVDTGKNFVTWIPFAQEI